mmetsp:Transcript_57832/g.176156  ORF Transcript_57832/g.176156 Transcript_57832/m.176156 type:complete len:225 (+) Transcript_57832:380-1054(+)
MAVRGGSAGPRCADHVPEAPHLALRRLRRVPGDGGQRGGDAAVAVPPRVVPDPRRPRPDPPQRSPLAQVGHLAVQRRHGDSVVAGVGGERAPCADVRPPRRHAQHPPRQGDVQDPRGQGEAHGRRHGGARATQLVGRPPGHGPPRRGPRQSDACAPVGQPLLRPGRRALQAHAAPEGHERVRDPGAARPLVHEVGRLRRAGGAHAHALAHGEPRPLAVGIVRDL